MAVSVAELEAKLSLETSKFQSGAKAAVTAIGEVNAAIQKTTPATAAADTAMSKLATSYTRATASASGISSATTTMTQSMQDASRAADRQQAAFDKAFDKKHAATLQELDQRLKDDAKSFEQTAQAANKFDDAQQKATKSTKDLGTSLQSVPGPIGEAASATQRWVSMLTGPGGIVMAVGAAAIAAVGFAKSMGDDIERLDNLSAATGLGVKALQALEFAAKQAGEAPEGLARGFGKVTEAISQVVQGKDQAAAAFVAIGVPMEKLVREGANAEQILEATAQKLMAIPDPTARAAAAMDIFGMRGKAILPVLEQIAKEGIGGYTKALEDAGLITSKETDAMAREFDKMFDKVMAAGEQFKNWFKSNFAKTISQSWIELQLLIQDPTLIFRMEEFIKRINDAMAQLTAEERGPRFGEKAPRVLAPGKAELDAAKKAADEAKKAADEAQKRAEEAGSKIAAIFGEIAAEIAEQVQYEKPYEGIAEGLKKASEEATKAEKSLDDYTISLGETRQEILENNRVIDANVGAYQEAGEAGDVYSDSVFKVGQTMGTAATMSAEAIRQIKGSGEAYTLADTAVKGFTASVSAAEAADQATTEAIKGMNAEAKKTPAAFDAKQAFADFKAGAEDAVEGFRKSMLTVKDLGQQTASGLMSSFQQSFFYLFKGETDKVEGIWDQFLKNLQDMILNFLASKAVEMLFNMGASILSGLAGAGGGIVGLLASLVGGIGSGGKKTGGEGAVGAVGSTVVSAGASAAMSALAAAAIDAAAGMGLISTSTAAAASGMLGVTTASSAAAASATSLGTSFGAAAAADIATTGAITGMGSAAATAAPAVGAVGEAAVVAAPAVAATGEAAATTAVAFGGAGIGVAALAVAAPLAVGAIGFLLKESNTYTDRLKSASNELVKIQEGLAKGAVGGEAGAAGMAHVVSKMGEFFDAHGKLTEDAFAKLGGIFGEDREKVVAAIYEARGAFVEQTGKMVDAYTSGAETITNAAGVNTEREMALLTHLPGIEKYSQEQIQNLAGMLASTGMQTEATRGIIEAIVNDLSPNQAEATALLGKILDKDFMAQLMTPEGGAFDQGAMEGANAVWQSMLAAAFGINEQVGLLGQTLLTSSEGVVNMTTAAQMFGEALFTGVGTAQEMSGLFQALATEHGPGFTAALQASLVEMGATTEQAAAAVAQMGLMTEGAAATGAALADPVNAQLAVTAEAVGGVNAGLGETNNQLGIAGQKLGESLDHLGNMETAANAFAGAIASGTAPANELAGTFDALANQHGPGFEQAVIAALEALGLTRLEAEALAEEIKGLSEMQVTIPVNFEVHDMPGGGGGGGGGGGERGGGGAGGGEERGHRLGGWAGGERPAGYQVGGWIRQGTYDQDSVLAMLARGEFIVRAPAAGYAPRFLEAYNESPQAALAEVRGFQAGGAAGDPHELEVPGRGGGGGVVALMLEQNALLREQNQLIRTLARGGSPRGWGF